MRVGIVLYTVSGNENGLHWCDTEMENTLPSHFQIDGTSFHFNWRPVPLTDNTCPSNEG